MSEWQACRISVMGQEVLSVASRIFASATERVHIYFIPTPSSKLLIKVIKACYMVWNTQFCLHFICKWYLTKLISSS